MRRVEGTPADVALTNHHQSVEFACHMRVPVCVFSSRIPVLKYVVCVCVSVLTRTIECTGCTHSTTCILYIQYMEAVPKCVCASFSLCLYTSKSVFFVHVHVCVCTVCPGVCVSQWPAASHRALPVGVVGPNPPS